LNYLHKIWLSVEKPEHKNDKIQYFNANLTSVKFTIDD